MSGRRFVTVVLVGLLCAFTACTSKPGDSPAPTSAPSSTPPSEQGETQAPSVRVDQPTAPTSAQASLTTVPVFASAAARDTAFLAQLAPLKWTDPQDSPAFSSTFIRASHAYATDVCTQARTARSIANIKPPTDGLKPEDGVALVRLAVSFYCPNQVDETAKARPVKQTGTCPKLSDVVVSSVLDAPAAMSANELHSTVSYVVAFMNLSDYPVWVQPEIKWKVLPIYKNGYPTGDPGWHPTWQTFTDPAVVRPETPARLLGAGEVWRVDARQNGPYRWTGLSARVNPAGFVPVGCGYQPE